MNGKAGRYNLDDAKIAIAQGARFGDVYPLLENVERDGDELRRFYVEMAPPHQIVSNGTCTIDTPLPLPLIIKGFPRDEGFTGNVCSNCGGSKMIRSGVCETCLDCGTTSGCS